MPPIVVAVKVEMLEEDVEQQNYPQLMEQEEMQAKADTFRTW